jgi:hypothetical protein
MLSSPACSPTNCSPIPHSFQSDRCHPERSEEPAFLFSPLSVLSVSLASPLFSYSCALFGHNENDNLFAFRRFRALSQKHPGEGYSRQSAIFSFRNRTAPDSALAAIPSTIRTSVRRAPNSRRISTYKTKDLKPFRISTYKNTGEGGGPNRWQTPPPQSLRLQPFNFRPFSRFLLLTAHCPLLAPSPLKPLPKLAHLYVCTCKKGPAAREPRYSPCAAS